MNWYRLILAQVNNGALPAQAPYGFWILPDGKSYPVVKHNWAFLNPPPKGVKGLGGVTNEQGALTAGWIRAVVGGGGGDRMFDAGRKPTPAQINAIIDILIQYSFKKIALDLPNTGYMVLDEIDKVEKACGRASPAKNPADMVANPQISSPNDPQAALQHMTPVQRTRFRTGD